MSVVSVGAQSTASLSGTVTDEGNVRPVRQAIVTIAGGGLVHSRSTITDDRGRFTFAALPAGRFTLSAAKAAHVTNAYGSRRPGRPGTPLTLTAGQQLANIRVVLPRGAVVTGVVRDRNGEPAGGLSVSALTVGALASATGSMVFRPENVWTDDRGVYRIFGLPPGEYVVFATMRLVGAADIGVMAAADVDAALQQLQRGAARGSAAIGAAAAGRGSSPPPGRRGFTFAPTFHPATSRLEDAARLTLAAGDERQGVDIILQLVPTAAIEGVVLMPDGSRPSAMVSLDPDGPQLGSSLGLMAMGTPPGADGRFGFRGVTPGSYTVVARSVTGRGRGAAAGPPQPVMWATAKVSVDGEDVRGLALTLRPGLQFSGRVAFDARTLTPPDDFTKLRVSVRPEMGPMPAGVVGFVSTGGQTALLAADGTFAVAGLLPGRYRVDVSFTVPSTGWTLRSAMVGSRDLLDSGMEIGSDDITGAVLTLSDQHTELSGTLQSAAGLPAPEYVVIVLPADKSMWRANSRRLKTARPGTDGRFVLRDLPGGEYLIAALTDVEPEDLNDAAFLEKVAAGSVKIVLTDGERKVQDLRIAR